MAGSDVAQRNAVASRDVADTVLGETHRFCFGLELEHARREMGEIILDLCGDPQWPAVALAQGAEYVLLAKTNFWLPKPHDAVVIVDGRNRYEDSLELIARLAAESGPDCARVLVTERESPREHARAYRAGTTQIVFMGVGATGHATLLADVAAAIRSR